MVLIHVALGEASAHICRVHSIPRCLVIFSRAARWFIYLLATCHSGKRTRGVKGEKMERKRKWKEGGREGQVMRNRGETQRERRQWARKSVQAMITCWWCEEQVERHIQSSFTDWQSQWRTEARGERRKWKRHDRDSVSSLRLVRRS